jgi:hypothetical protein
LIGYRRGAPPASRARPLVVDGPDHDSAPGLRRIARLRSRSTRVAEPRFPSPDQADGWAQSRQRHFRLLGGGLASACPNRARRQALVRGGPRALQRHVPDRRATRRRGPMGALRRYDPGRTDTVLFVIEGHDGGAGPKSSCRYTTCADFHEGQRSLPSLPLVDQTIGSEAPDGRARRKPRDPYATNAIVSASSAELSPSRGRPHLGCAASRRPKRPSAGR